MLNFGGNNMEQLTKLQEKLKITAFKMKVIAVLSMLIDHYAAIMILTATGIDSLSQSMQVQYSFMRGIGRIAFPIFAFLVVEGFLKTKDRKKYALRMLIFAIISTPAYNIAFGQTFIYTRKFLIAFIFGNVMWTFLLAVVMMSIMELIEQKNLNIIVSYICYAVIIAVFAFIAENIKCDRKALGIISIGLFYILRACRVKQVISGIVSFYFHHPMSYLGLIPILFYNGERGKDFRYFFYIFYPLHLFILALLRWQIYGIGSFIK